MQKNDVATSGKLQSFRELRKFLDIPKEEFDQGVRDLIKSGKISPHRHDFATSLEPHELEQLVHGGDTKAHKNEQYYVGAALRG